MNTWCYFDSGRCDPALNMAVDDALLQSARSIGVPVLRFYDWVAPAATFGYFQKIAAIETATRLRPLIRRPTGGGLVPHLNDWTYSLTVPPTHDWYALRAVDSYRQMHEWIRLALQSLGVESRLADCCREEMPGQCFVGYEKFDVLSGGQKIAGAAQRRNKLGLLIQGSLQPTPADVERNRFIQAMIEQGNRLFDGHAMMADSDLVLAPATGLVNSRYSAEAYNRRR